MQSSESRSDPLEVLLEVASEFASRSGGGTSLSPELLRRLLQIETDHLYAEPGERSTVVATVRQLIEQSATAT